MLVYVVLKLSHLRSIFSVLAFCFQLLTSDVLCFVLGWKIGYQHIFVLWSSKILELVSLIASGGKTPTWANMFIKELKTNRNGNSAIFFLYVCNGKKNKELFASTLNGITASVRCVSSMIVVLNAILTRLIAAHANRKDSEKRINI